MGKPCIGKWIASIGTLIGVVAALPGTSPASAAPQARPNPLTGVYHPYRLQVIKPFVTVTGTVERIRREPDHDFHINLKPDAKFATMINAKNREREHGDLVVEVIPMDANRVPVPHAGQHISVSGSYVLDKDHGWMEIHPAWYINGHGSAHYTAAAAAQSVKEGIDGNDEIFGSHTTSTHHATTTTKPTATRASSGLSIVSFTQNVYPGDYATLEVHTKPGAEADIEVDYESGPSHAHGLGEQPADAHGDVTWTWKVGTRTTPGNWPVIVTSDGKTLQTTLDVQ